MHCFRKLGVRGARNPLFEAEIFFQLTPTLPAPTIKSALLPTHDGGGRQEPLHRRWREELRALSASRLAIGAPGGQATRRGTPLADPFDAQHQTFVEQPHPVASGP